jgi:hypothetical protein
MCRAKQRRHSDQVWSLRHLAFGWWDGVWARGQEMKVTLTKMQKRFGIAKMKGEAYVDGQLACEAELMLVLATDPDKK